MPRLTDREVAELADAAIDATTAYLNGKVRRAALDQAGDDFPSLGAALERTLLENA